MRLLLEQGQRSGALYVLSCTKGPHACTVMNVSRGSHVLVRLALKVSSQSPDGGSWYKRNASTRCWYAAIVRRRIFGDATNLLAKRWSGRKPPFSTSASLSAASSTIAMSLCSARTT